MTTRAATKEDLRTALINARAVLFVLKAIVGDFSLMEDADRVASVIGDQIREIDATLGI